MFVGCGIGLEACRASGDDDNAEIAVKLGGVGLVYKVVLMLALN